jgi:hypothetical protein
MGVVEQFNLTEHLEDLVQAAKVTTRVRLDQLLVTGLEIMAGRDQLWTTTVGVPGAVEVFLKQVLLAQALAMEAKV